MKTHLKLLTFALALGTAALTPATAATITANVTITVASAGGTGFTVGNTFDLIFTTLPGLGLPNNGDDADVSLWEHNNDGQPAIWSTITGGPLTGTWTDTPLGTDPYSYLYAYRNVNTLTLIAATDSTDGTGLFAGSEELNYLIISVGLDSGVLPAWPGAGLGTADAVLPSSGTVIPTVLLFGNIATDNHLYGYSFNVNSLTFGAVPEPSRALLLLGGLMGMALRRRR